MELTVRCRTEATVELAAYLNSAFESSDAGEIAHALGVAARQKGMSHVAQAAGCAREQLYRSLSKTGNPTLKTVLAVLAALTAPKKNARYVSRESSTNKIAHVEKPRDVDSIVDILAALRESVEGKARQPKPKRKVAVSKQPKGKYIEKRR